MSKSLKGISPFKLYYSKSFTQTKKLSNDNKKRTTQKQKIKRKKSFQYINKRKKEDLESAFCLKINTLKKNILSTKVTNFCVNFKDTLTPKMIIKRKTNTKAKK